MRNFPILRQRILRGVALSLTVLYAISLVLPLGAHAQTSLSAAGGVISSGATSVPSTADQAAVEQYWTPQRLLSAKPLELHPQVGTDGLPVAVQGLAETAAPVGESGAPPSVKKPTNVSKVLVPLSLLPAPQAQSEVMPFATSSYGAYFTTGRVFPNSATKTYPYSTTGKLFFTIQGTGNFMCTAAVLQPRIVVTAGHCVAQASTDPAVRHFYTNWLFVPAYRNGVAPYGTWTPITAWVTDTWSTSDGSVPNAQDVGMLVMNDQLINGTLQRVGDLAGRLGWQTNALSTNHVMMLGYPGNLDSGVRMEQTTAQIYAAGGNNTYVYGSAMRGGASGGPWIQDFGVQPAGAPPVALGGNVLIAVTSYGPIATEPAYLGASNLTSEFVNLLNAACGAANSGNC